MAEKTGSVQQLKKLWGNLKPIQKDILTTEKQVNSLIGEAAKLKQSEIDPDTPSITPALMTTASVIFTSNTDENEKEDSESLSDNNITSEEENGETQNKTVEIESNKSQETDTSSDTSEVSIKKKKEKKLKEKGRKKGNIKKRKLSVDLEDDLKVERLKNIMKQEAELAKVKLKHEKTIAALKEDHLRSINQLQIRESSAKTKLAELLLKNEMKNKMKNEKKVSDEKEVENIVSFPQKKQIMSLSLHQSYSETSLKTTLVGYTWRISHFKPLSDALATLTSPSFPKNGQYMIKMEFPRSKDVYGRERSTTTDTIKLYLLTTEPFIGSCTTAITCPLEKIALPSKSISGYISNMRTLCEYSVHDLKLFKQMTYTDSLIVQCLFKVFNLENNTNHTCDIPLSIISKDFKSFEKSNLDEFESMNGKSIKFIIEKEYCVIQKKLLYATNSNYFKNICLKYEGTEKDMTNELKANNEIEAFKQMLLFIRTGSRSVIGSYDYETLKKLFITADKYDVLTLKSICEYFLLTFNTKKTVLDLIQFAFSYNTNFLEIHLAAFIKFYKNEILNTQEFRNLSEKNSNKIMEIIEKYEKNEIRESNTQLQAQLLS